jgi:hypothetical protein
MPDLVPHDVLAKLNHWTTAVFLTTSQDAMKAHKGGDIVCKCAQPAGSFRRNVVDPALLWRPLGRKHEKRLTGLDRLG